MKGRKGEVGGGAARRTVGGARVPCVCFLRSPGHASPGVHQCGLLAAVNAEIAGSATAHHRGYPWLWPTARPVASGHREKKKFGINFPFKTVGVCGMFFVVVEKGVGKNLEGRFFGDHHFWCLGYFSVMKMGWIFRVIQYAGYLVASRNMRAVGKSPSDSLLECLKLLLTWCPTFPCLNRRLKPRFHLVSPGLWTAFSKPFPLQANSLQGEQKPSGVDSRRQKGGTEDCKKTMIPCGAA